ncbi:MAG: hypothetical protein IT449_13610 [Phycisphaerales bacterium]|nr:hypothetical protein [Phycisphaerales bacterium]
MTIKYRRFAMGVFGLALGASSLSTNAGELASRTPADALIYLGWTDVPNDGQSLVGLTEAVLASPPVQQEMGPEGAHVRRVCAVLRMMLAHPGALVLLPAPPDRPFAEGLGAVIHAGAGAEPLTAKLAELVTALHGGQAPVRAPVGDASLMRADVPGGALYFGAVKEHLVIGACEATAARLVGMTSASSGSLADSPGYKLACSKFEPAGKGFALTFFAQVPALLRLVNSLEPLAPDEAALQEKVFTAMGISALRSVYLRVDESPYGPRIVAFTQVEGEAGGIVSLYRQKPLTDDDVRLVPKDASFAAVSNFDFSALWQEGLKAADQVSPEPRAAVEAAVTQASLMFGFHPVNDLLANFGDTWAIYDAPSHGGILITGLVLCGETKDSAALNGMIGKTVQFLTPMAAMGKVGLRIRQMKHGGREVNYLLLGGLPVPVAPSWGFAGDRFVIGLHPQTVAVALDQADAKTRGESLIDHPDYKLVRPRLPKDITSLAYADTRATYRFWYALREAAHTMAASLTAVSETPFDLGSVPPFPEEYAGIHNFIAAHSYDADGLMYSAYGAHPAALILSSNGGLTSTTMLASILLPSLARAREQAKRQVSASNLRGIGAGCMVYASDNEEKFPASLDALVESGTITEPMLHSPRDPTGGRSYVYLDGQTAASDARNVLAYEKPIDNEGTHVLFCDSHVEWMKPVAFRQAMVETYRRLNRLDKLPPEFRE